MHYSNSTQSLSRNILSTFYHSSAYNVPAIQVILAILVLVICTSLYWKPSAVIDVPYVGYRSSWEPRFLAQIRYTFSASSMISEGYKKVCGLPIGACSRTRQISNDSQQWKDSLFQISRYDGDVLILSRNYLDDLHNRPPQELSAIHGLIEVRRTPSKPRLSNVYQRNLTTHCIRILAAAIVASDCWENTTSASARFRYTLALMTSMFQLDPC